MKTIFLSGGTSSDWREAIKQQYPQYHFLERRSFDDDNDSPEQARKIIEADLAAVGQADIVLANMLEYSAGTEMQIFYAKSFKNKTVVVVGPKEFLSNVWLKYFSDCVTTNFEEAFGCLQQLELFANCEGESRNEGGSKIISKKNSKTVFPTLHRPTDSSLVC